MNIKIGEKIKQLRRKNDITQDKLAEYLGVTAQAISRWESGNCYPDIEILPAIASFFKVTIDELLGYDCSEREQQAIVDSISKLVIAGRSAEAISEARRGLALYPQNHGIAVMLASQLLGAFQTKKAQSGVECDFTLIDEGIALCQRVLRDCAGGSGDNDMLRLASKNILILMLCRRDRNEEAAKIAQTMPSLTMSRELMIQSTLMGADRVKYSLSTLPLIVTMITSLFLNNLNHPEPHTGVPQCKYNADDCLRDIAVWDAVYSQVDRNDGGNEKRSCWVYMFLNQRMAKSLLDAGDKIGAAKYLRLAVECLPFVDAGKGNFVYNLTQRSAVVSRDLLCKSNDYNGKTSAYVMLHGYVENGYFNGLEDEPLYQECLELLQKYTEQ